VSEQFEKDLLLESETLSTLIPLFRVFSDVLEKTLEEGGGYLDDDLLIVLQVILKEAVLVLDKSVKIPYTDGGKMKTRRIQGLVKQMADVMDEIDILQAGLDTKHGIKDEDTEDT